VLYNLSEIEMYIPSNTTMLCILVYTVLHVSAYFLAIIRHLLITIQLCISYSYFLCYMLIVLFLFPMLYANCLYTLYVVLLMFHTRALLSLCTVAGGFLYVYGRGPSCLLGSVRRRFSVVDMDLEILAISTQVFLGFPGSKSKCWDSTRLSKLPLYASHVALPT
jgi:hypothetical protein